MTIKNEWLLSKSHLSYWLRQLRKEAELIGPLRDEGNDIVFRSVEKIHKIAADCPASLPSPKEFLLPQFEPMLIINSGAESGGKSETSDLRDTRRRVIFGVRSCDISALILLDRFFMAGMKDPYYAERRKNTLLISVVCNNPDPTCFCIGLGSGPYLEANAAGEAAFDVQMTDLGDRYFVQAGSHGGAKTVKSYASLFTRPVKTDYEDLYEVFLSSKARFQKRISLESSRRMMVEGRVGDDFWREIAQTCIECGTCVYDCPLCTCFTVTDRETQEGTERSRMWDACVFKGFTRLAGGVLPNREKSGRLKRWHYHKVVHYPETIGGFGCVGCGRCTIGCPGRIDMASVALRMKALAVERE